MNSWQHTPNKKNISTYPDGRPKVCRKRRNRYGFIRYADDMLVTAETKQDIEAIVPVIETWLKQRGLELNLEKTRITSAQEGIDFLGFHLRQFKGSCYTFPQKEKAYALLADIRAWLKVNISAKPEAVIYKLNPLLRGWGNYYRHGASKQTFNYIDHQIWKALWQWARKRHPHKGKRWIVRKYFIPPYATRWTLYTTLETRQGCKKILTLFKLSDIPIERHIKVKDTASPDDPQLQSYWTHRQTRTGKSYWTQNSKLQKVAKHQNWRCPVCNEHLFNGEELHTHHKVPIQDGGTDQMENLVHLHKTCHKHLHQMSVPLALQEA